MNKTILMATGQYEIDNLGDVLDGYDIVGIVEYKDELIEKTTELQPDIVMVGALLGGKEPLFPILNNLKFKYPDIRIIYLTTEVDIADQVLVNSLGTLASLGVYDIIEDNLLSPGKIQYLLDTPKGEEHVLKFKNSISDSSFGKTSEKIDIVLPEDDTTINKLRSNLVTFVSSKGGTGKTTLLTNAAIAISEAGVNTENGFKPSILILDLDFYQYTAGRMLNTNDNKKNILTVLHSIKEKLISNSIEHNNEEFQNLIQEIEDASHKVKGRNNIRVLTGPSTSFDLKSLDDITEEEIAFLIGILTSKYDMVIVDTGNDILHRLAKPTLELSHSIYYVLDMDFQTFLQEGHISTFYKENDFDIKVKYILNKYVHSENLEFGLDKISDVGYNIDFKVDLYNPIEMLNNSFKGKFLIDNKEAKTEMIRFDILKIADDIWGINNFKAIEEVLSEDDETQKIIKKEKVKINNDDFFTKLGKKLTGK